MDYTPSVCPHRQQLSLDDNITLDNTPAFRGLDLKELNPALLVSVPHFPTQRGLLATLLFQFS